MRTRRMTIRGILIAIAIEGVVLGTCISFPWLVVVPLAAALVFVPQSIAIGVCAYLTIRDRSAWGAIRRRNPADLIRAPAEAATPEIWFIETAAGAVDPRGIVFESSSKSPP